MIKYVVLAIFSTFLSSLAQVLLKKGAQKKRGSILREYCNAYVLGGYAITLGCMFLMILAYKGFPYKYGAIIESFGYIFIMILSRAFFGEKVTWKKMIGNILIICGVIVFSM